MEKNLPQRKNIRLKEYDYSTAGYYFVTICTYLKKPVLSKVVGGGFHAAPHTELTPIGEQIVKTINYINQQYLNVKIDKYVIMPNHIHLILILENSEPGGRGNPPLHKVIGQLKSFTNKKYNDLSHSINIILWQRNYYDH